MLTFQRPSDGAGRDMQGLAGSTKEVPSQVSRPLLGTGVHLLGTRVAGTGDGSV